MIRDILRGFLSQPGVVDKGRCYPLWVQRWDHRQEPLPKPAVKSLLTRAVMDSERLGCTHFYEDTSFPFGGVEAPFSKYVSNGGNRGNLRHPRVGDLLELMAGLVDFRILPDTWRRCISERLFYG